MASAPLPRPYQSKVEGLMAATKIQLSQIQKTADLFVTQPAKHTELNAPRECETMQLGTP